MCSSDLEHVVRVEGFFGHATVPQPQVMVRPQTRGNYLRLWYRGVAEETLDTDYMLAGFKQLAIDVEE